MYTMKQARLIKGFTQREMADKIGVHVDTYRNIENNPERATIEKARKFCEVVDMSVSDIFFGSNSTKSRNAS